MAQDRPSVHSAASPEDVGPRILAVDDDEMARFLLQTLLPKLGYSVRTASGGDEALAILEAEAGFAAILLDREMPGKDGIATTRMIKADPALERIPIIMVTGSTAPEEVQEGIEAGVFYYLPKPVNERVLSSVVAAALRQHAQTEILLKGGNETRGFELTTAAKFTFRSLDEAESLAGFVANYFPDPERSIEGIGALLINAVEHGICGIGLERKGKLLAGGLWREAVDRMLSKLPVTRTASAAVSRKETGVTLVVSDPGNGFDWRQFTTIDMSRSSASHGRGILRARSFAFDAVDYNAAGNQVLAFVRAKERFEW